MDGRQFVTLELNLSIAEALQLMLNANGIDSDSDYSTDSSEGDGDSYFLCDNYGIYLVCREANITVFNLLSRVIRLFDLRC